MTLLPMARLLDAAERGGYAVGAFNVSDLNQAVAVLDAARAESSPVIVQAIAGQSAYGDEDWWWDRLREVVASYSDVTVALHLDHGRTFEDCVRAVGHGFTSVMIDASRDSSDNPNDLESNIALTAKVAEFAHGHGVSVEGELGTVGGAEGGLSGEHEELVYASPDQAVEFVRRTGVDALAVAVGTSHGSVKFTSEAHGDRLKLDLIEEIKNRLPGTRLVLHGSSSIPGDAVATINSLGGRVKPSFGISVPQKSLAVERGIRKINQGTDSHLVWTAALRTHLTDHPAEVDPAGAVKAATAAMTRIVRTRMREFGSAGADRRTDAA